MNKSQGFAIFVAGPITLSPLAPHPSVASVEASNLPVDEVKQELAAGCCTGATPVLRNLEDNFSSPQTMASPVRSLWWVYSDGRTPMRFERALEAVQPVDDLSTWPQRINFQDGDFMVLYDGALGYYETSPTNPQMRVFGGNCFVWRAEMAGYFTGPGVLHAKFDQVGNRGPCGNSEPPPLGYPLGYSNPYQPPGTCDQYGCTPTCSDGIDNDGNGYRDSADPVCHSDGNAGNPNSYTPSSNNEGYNYNNGPGCYGQNCAAPCYSSNCPGYQPAPAPAPYTPPPSYGSTDPNMPLTPEMVRGWCVSGDCSSWRFVQLTESNGYVNPHAVKMLASGFATINLPTGTYAQTASGTFTGPTQISAAEASIRHTGH